MVPKGYLRQAKGSTTHPFRLANPFRKPKTQGIPGKLPQRQENPRLTLEKHGKHKKKLKTHKNTGKASEKKNKKKKTVEHRVFFFPLFAFLSPPKTLKECPHGPFQISKVFLPQLRLQIKSSGFDQFLLEFLIFFLFSVFFLFNVTFQGLLCFVFSG